MSVSASSRTYLICAAACWGLGTVLTKYALAGFSASVLLPFQLVCSVVMLGFCVLITRTPLRTISHPAKIAALGVLNPGVAYALGLIGLSRIDASVSVIVWATEPVLIVVLAYVLLHERLSAVATTCLALAMVGVLLIVGLPSMSGSPSGVAWTLAAVLACALYSVLLRRTNLTDATLSVVFVQQVSALGFATLVLAVSTATSSNSFHPTGLQFVAAAASGSLYYGIAFLFYVAGLRRTSAARAGTLLTLIPVFGLLFSVLLLGETLAPAQALGSAIVVASMASLVIREARQHTLGAAWMSDRQP